MDKKKEYISYNFTFAMSDDDYKSLEIFKERSVSFIEERKRLNLGRVTHSITRVGDGTFTGTSSVPSERDLTHFYLAFRFFFLQREPSYFNRVINIVDKNIKDITVNRFLKFLKSQWEGSLSKTHSEIFDFQYTPKELIDLWFNVHFFHSDVDKKAKLDKINAILSKDLSRAMLFQSVFDSSLAVSSLYNSLKELGPNGGLFFIPSHLVGFKIKE